MNIFRSLTNFFRRAPTGHPFDLTDGEIAHLQSLRTHDGWPILLKVLDYDVNLKADALLAPSLSSEHVHFFRGQISGLRRAALLVDEILTKEAEIARHEQRKRAAAEPSDSARRAATFGTPAWRR